MERYVDARAALCSIEFTRAENFSQSFLFKMTRDDYRAEAAKLRHLATSPLTLREDGTYLRDMAALYDTLAWADETLARSATIYKRPPKNSGLRC